MCPLDPITRRPITKSCGTNHLTMIIATVKLVNLYVILERTYSMLMCSGQHKIIVTIVVNLRINYLYSSFQTLELGSYMSVFDILYGILLNIIMVFRNIRVSA